MLYIDSQFAEEVERDSNCDHVGDELRASQRGLAKRFIMPLWWPEAPRQQGSSSLPERVLTKAVRLFTWFLRVTAFPPVC